MVSILIKKETALIIVYLVTLCSLSFIIHMPTDAQLRVIGKVVLRDPVYVDLYYSDYALTFISPCSNKPEGLSVWRDVDKALRFCSGEFKTPRPYLDYRFNKPPLTALIWFALTSISFKLSNDVYGAAAFFYITLSVASSIALFIHTFLLLKLLNHLRVEGGLKILSIVSPTLLIYLIYSWEAVTLPLLTGFIYGYVKRNYTLAFVNLSILCSMNTYGLVILFLALYSFILLNDRSGASPLLGLTPLVASYVALGLLSLDSFRDQLLWFTHSFCNNCIYLVFFRNPTCDVLRTIATICWVIVTVAYVPYNPSTDNALLRLSYVSTYISLTNLFLIVFTPQQVLYVLPYLPPLYSVLKRGYALTTHYSVDVLNSLIITLWFRDYELRRILKFLGIDIQHNPLELESPIQWIAQARNILLLGLTVTLAMKHLRGNKEFKASSV